jgi:hypothetical protein
MLISLVLRFIQPCQNSWLGVSLDVNYQEQSG